ncbi:lysophospholipase [Flavobacteriales bacterium]|nr:lysophospholipase [Flavobacteriales bacterium]
MTYNNFEFQGYNKFDLMGYSWTCDQPKANVLIVHGMSEHAGRYNAFAEFLNNNGVNVFSSDLRGHGKTAGSIENVGLFAMENGWQKVIQDQKILITQISQQNDLPTFVLGHSMGSFVARSLSFSGEKRIAGYLFSATAGDPGFLGRAGKIIATINSQLLGKKNRSKLLDKMAFGDFNKKIENPRTTKDWLTKDNSIVDEYMNDPFCMQLFTSQFYTDLLEGVLTVNHNNNIKRMEKVPYLLFAGEMDPVGDYGAGVQKVFQMMLKEQHNVQLKLYEDGRHEMLNETNRSNVYDDVLNWIITQLT